MGKTLADGYLELRLDPSKLDADTKKAFQAIGFKQKGRQAGEEAGEGLASALKEKVKGGLGSALGAIGIGAGIGAGLSSGISKALNVGAANDKLRAQLGLNAADSARLGKIAGQLYSKGYGESMEDVNDAIASVVTQIPSLRNASVPVLKDIAAGAMDINRVFGQDMEKTTSAVSSMLKSGLAPNAKAALDTLTKGFQSGANKADDLLDTFTEYSVQFTKLGLDGPTSLGIINQLLAGGARNADVAADAVKEFSIRAIDGSKNTVAGYKLLGLNAKDMAAQIAKGGPAAKQAFDTVVDKLNSIQDPVKRNTAGVDLFGTKWEDLGASFKNLDVSKATSQIGQVAGATKGLAQQSDSAKIQAFGRSIETAFVGVVGGKVIPALQSTIGWLDKHNTEVRIAALVVGGLATAYGVGAAAAAVQAAGGFGQLLLSTRLVTGAQVLATGVARGLGIAFRFMLGPIGLILTGLTLLGVGLVYLFNHNKAFHDFVIAAWNGIKAAVAGVVDWFTGTALPWLQKVWQGIAAGAVWLWHNVLEPVWNGIKAVIGVVITIVRAYIAGLVAEFRIIAGVATWLWHNIFQPVFTGIGFVVKAAWVVIQIALKAFQLFLTNVIFPVVRFLYNNVVKPIFTAIGVVISAWWNGYAKPVFGLAKAGFSALGSGLSAVWNNVIKPVFHALGNFITGSVLPAFRRGVDLIRAAWSKVQDAAKLPVKFVVENVINPFVGGINEAAKVVGIKARITPIKLGFADGGQVPGYAAGGRIGGAPSAVDNRLAPATIPGVGAVKLAGGEFIVNARDTLKALPLLRWVNAGMKGGPGRIGRYLGKPLADMPGDGSEGWAFADGGLVGWAKDVWGAITHPAETIKKPFQTLLGKIPGAGMIKDFLVGSAKKVLNGAVSWLTGLGNGDGGGNVAKAMAFVRSQVGKPYVWASAGPGGYDCSGIVSAVYNVMKGTNPYSHTFTTDSLPGSWFTPNRVGPLMAGWSHPGQSPAGAVGHMAGQIGALPFESTGSTGVRIGGAARRITAFAHKGGARFANGGLVGRIPLFDTGGTLAPGINTVYNGLGRPEPLVRADSGNTYNINVTVAPGGHPAETGRQIIAAIQASEKINGTRWRQ